MITPELFYYLSIAATTAIPALCVSIGQGRSCSALIEALNEQPTQHKNLNLLFLIGMAMTEFIGILGMLMSFIFFTRTTPTLAMAFAKIGSALAIIVPAALIGLVAAYPLMQIFHALARQPLSYQKLLPQLLLTQIMLQTPVLLGFVLSWIIHSSIIETLLLTEGIKLLASGLSFALGVIGPVIGLALFGNQACKSVGLNSRAIDSIFTFTFMSQGIIETPILLVLVVAVTLCFVPASTASYAGVAYLASALCMSFATLIPGISSGATASAACKQIPARTEEYPTIANTSLLCQVFIETNAIYGLIVVMIIIFTLP